MIAIYGLQPIGKDGALEANGEIHWYCSATCAERDLVELRREMATEATAYIAGECGPNGGTIKPESKK
jgi:hypothetical protein